MKMKRSYSMAELLTTIWDRYALALFGSAIQRFNRSTLCLAIISVLLTGQRAVAAPVQIDRSLIDQPTIVEKGPDHRVIQTIREVVVGDRTNQVAEKYTEL